MKKQYIIRDYKSGDEGALNDLFNLVFNQKRSLKKWHWLYRNNPLGNINLIAVAEVEGKIIAQHANVPLSLKYRDKNVVIGQPVDNLIHPDFRGGRLIKDIHKLASDQYVREGLPFGFGFPNEIYYPVGKKLLKYEDLCPMPTFFKRLNLRLSLKKRLPLFPSSLESVIRQLSAKTYRLQVLMKKSGEKGIAIQNLSTLNNDMDILWERAKNRYGIMTTRDYRFLKWRYMDKPDDSYHIIFAKDDKPAGYVVLKISKRGKHLIGYIVDILSINTLIDKILIGAALDYFISKKADYSLCRILREDDLCNTLKGYGFKEHAGFLAIPVTYQQFDKELDLSYFKNPVNWHLTYADQIDVEF